MIHKSQEDSIVIALMGDVMIGRLVDQVLFEKPPEYIWGDILPLLKMTDLNLLNLEAALTHSKEKVAKTFNFKADPKHVECLKKAQIHVVNVANNHILDYSESGLIETLKVLNEAGIAHVGAGKNLTEAKKPVVLSKSLLKIGILGCTDNEPLWKANDEKAGIHYIDVAEGSAMEREIQELRKKVDVLILSIHWGPNMREKPSPAFRTFAHRAIDLGVDVFHGHSAHIFQGVEIYKQKIILYDTGDFIDDYYVDPLLRNDRSFLFFIEINKKGICNLSLLPVRIADFQVNRAKEEDLTETILRMQSLSKEFGTSFEVKEKGFLPFVHLYFKMV